MPVLLESTIVPEVSVVMAVYNGSDFLDRSIRSILTQTFANFEFIIIDDGSTDDSLSIINSFSKEDDRILVISNSKNQGLTKSLNSGCKVARGRYIARQDADDFSEKTRLERQMDFLRHRDDIILLGSRAFEIGGQRQMLSRYFNEGRILTRIKFQNPFIHSSVVINAKAFKSIGYYNEKFRTSQDYDAWIRLSKIGRICMLEIPLVTYCINPNSISNRIKYRQCFNSIRVRWNHVGYIGCKYFILGSLYRCIVTCTPRYLIDIKQKVMGRS